MTKLQQHVNFVNAAEKLLTILDKLDQSNGAEIYKQQAREQRRQLKTQVIQCRMPAPEDKITHRKPGRFQASSATSRWLGQ